MTKFSHVPFVITTFFLYVKDKKLRENSHWISVVLNSDGYSFKSSGSTTRSSTRLQFSYSVCTCSCGSDEYSSLYRNGYKQFFVPINKTSPFSSLLLNRYRNWCFFYFVYLSDWGVSGKAYVGHLLGLGCSFNFCIHLVPYLPGCRSRFLIKGASLAKTGRKTRTRALDSYLLDDEIIVKQSTFINSVRLRCSSSSEQIQYKCRKDEARSKSNAENRSLKVMLAFEIMRKIGRNPRTRSTSHFSSGGVRVI